MRPGTLVKDFFVIYCLLGIFVGLLFALVSCQSPRPFPVIYPPGFVQPAVFSNNIPVVRKSVLVRPPNTSLTVDFVEGSADGCLMYELNPNGTSNLLQQFPFTNIFNVYLDNSQPHLIALTTFIMWPSPYIVTPYIDDNGNEVDTTNFYRESDPAYMVYVPQGCRQIGAFTMPDGSIQVVGWSPGNLWLQSSPDQVNWSNVATITNLGSWQVTVDSSQSQMSFRAAQ